MRKTISTINKLKQNNNKIVCSTCYDASFAALQDEVVDVMLVGDSLGMVIQGHSNTLKVTVDNIVYHTQAVVNGSSNAFIMADVPFLSCVSLQQSFDTCKRLIQDGGAQIIKLEQNDLQADLVKSLTSQGIAVCCHLGLKPQFILTTGKYSYYGKSQEEADLLYQQAMQLQESGANILLLECVPQQLAKKIADKLTIPVIGIGSGPDVDGQILVLYDILGVSTYIPTFAKSWVELGAQQAIITYAQEVRSTSFPAKEHTLF